MLRERRGPGIASVFVYEGDGRVPVQKNPGLKSARNSFFLLVASSLCTLLILELALRAFGVGRYERSGFAGLPLKRADQTYERGAYPANATSYFRYPNDPRGYLDSLCRVSVHFNNWGIRGSDCTMHKPTGTTRIAVFGDSFTLGWGVRDEQTFPSVMQEELRKHIRGAEVLNFGVASANTPEEVHYFCEFGIKFEPDIAIITFFLNDTERDSVNNFVSGANRDFAALREYSYLANVVYSLVERILRYRRFVRHYHDGYKESCPEWQKVQAALRDVRDFAGRRHIRLVVAIYPVMVGLNSNYPFSDIHATIRKFCEKEGIPSVDLLPDFLGHNPAQLWVHPCDQHPNEIGQAIAGRALARYLMQNTLAQKP